MMDAVNIKIKFFVLLMADDLFSAHFHGLRDIGKSFLRINHRCPPSPIYYKLTIDVHFNSGFSKEFPALNYLVKGSYANI